MFLWKKDEIYGLRNVLMSVLKNGTTSTLAIVDGVREKLQTMNNPPLEIAFWIGDYLQKSYEKGRIHPYQLSAMLKLLDNMVEVLGICERILKTPIPLAYIIHLRQLIFLYCFTAPFELINHLKCT